MAKNVANAGITEMPDDTDGGRGNRSCDRNNIKRTMRA